MPTDLVQRNPRTPGEKNSNPTRTRIILALLLTTAPLAYTVEFWTGFDSGFAVSGPILGLSSVVCGFLSAGFGRRKPYSALWRALVYSIGFFQLNFLLMVAIWIARL